MGIRFDKFKTALKRISKNSDLAKRNNGDNDAIQPSRLADDAKGLIEDLYDNLGPRPAATKESRRAARHIASIFEEYTDDVTITSARIYTSMVKGYLLSLLIVSPIIALLTIFGLPIIALALAVFWAFSFFLQLKDKRTVLKVFMPSDEAANVHAVLNPDDVVEETIVFSSHHDTAPEDKVKKVFTLRYVTLYYMPAIGFLVLAITAVVKLLCDIAIRGSIIPGIASLPIILFSSFGLLLEYSSLISIRSIGKDYVRGAGDNLSGVSVVVEILRYFADKKKKGQGLRHTRLVFTSFDGEECGTQGSDAWYKSNSGLLENARVINFDGLYKEEDLVFLTQDGNGLVPLSATLASRCSEIASSMGYRIETGKLGIMAGETDASSAAKNGYKATALTSMRPEVKTPAHTSDDTPDKVETSALAAAISIGIRFATLEDMRLGTKKEESLGFLGSDKHYRLTR